jgi:hypothetical protein
MKNVAVLITEIQAGVVVGEVPLAVALAKGQGHLGKLSAILRPGQERQRRRLTKHCKNTRNYQSSFFKRLLFH